jgi:hypothetical protein
VKIFILREILASQITLDNDAALTVNIVLYKEETENFPEGSRFQETESRPDLG